MADHLPISESLGVFVGVSGFDWLAEGQAEPLKAVLAAIATGAVIMVRRHWLQKHRKD
ncbi:hypothetical protein [Dechloromonas denitrificans]|uniref:hypothetical protein n=2 Tax=Rhodocyclales TaxID=206389 RepID=UPI001CF98BB4|nr:hypothetical protein [Dechloromonas denitrificans]UCV09206.1 hypothetical protein KI615_06685 [Dechloromonas denitrificans]